MKKLEVSVVSVLVSCAFAALAAGAEPAATKTAARVEALGKDVMARFYFAFKTPMVAYRDGTVSVALGDGKEPKPMGAYETARPPADWFQPDFDADDWARLSLSRPIEASAGDGPSAGGNLAAPANHLICVRAPFMVNDPAAAADLRLRVDYIGGVLVRVNGHEIGRNHLPAGEIAPDTLAEKYPDDLLVGPDKVLAYAIRDKATQNALNAARYRSLAEVAIPAAHLRKGLNVLTLEIHRAPVNEGALPQHVKRPRMGGSARITGLYAYAGLKSLSLTGPAGAVGSARPAGVALWRPNPVETVSVGAASDAFGPPKAVIIAGARNGVFSDRLVVSSGSAAPVKGLKVAVSELKQAGGEGTLPAATVTVKYAAPFDVKKTHGPANRFDALLDAPPACRTVPIWLTARIPADATAGRYEGTVAVEAEGLERVEVPLRLTVYGWNLPDPKDWTIKHVGQSMTENLAEFYGVPRWSDKHWELVGKSMDLMAEINARNATINLTVNAYLEGNQESMVRWVKQPDGSYQYDFTLVDKWLDLVAAKFGKPLPLRVNIWGVLDRAKKTSAYGLAATVSVMDKATGALMTMEHPIFEPVETVAAFWKPVMDELLKRIEARGWTDVAGLGDIHYAGGPDKETLEVLKKIWPNPQGVSQQHGLTSSFGPGVPVIAATTVWNEGRVMPRGYSGLWNKKPWLVCGAFARNRHGEGGRASDLVVFRALPEEIIMRNHHGIFPLGIDLWKLYHANGRAWNVSGNSALGPGCSTRAILAPGPDGAVSSERFEMFRESSEVCEAILFLQRGLDEKRITGELAQKVNQTLNARSGNYARAGWMNYIWVPPYDDQTVWRELMIGTMGKNAEIYALCEEAAGAEGAEKRP